MILLAFISIFGFLGAYVNLRSYESKTKYPGIVKFASNLKSGKQKSFLNQLKIKK